MVVRLNFAIFKKAQQDVFFPPTLQSRCSPFSSFFWHVCFARYRPQ